MPLFQDNPNLDNQQTNADKQAQSQNNQPAKGWFSLPPAVMQLVPWIPLLLEQTTGQKIPQMTGTIAEIQLALTQIQTNQQQLLTHQKELANRILSLETNAANQFTNLTNQFQSLRLTHTREQKQIEYNPNPKLDHHEDQNY